MIITLMATVRYRYSSINGTDGYDSPESNVVSGGTILRIEDHLFDSAFDPPWNSPK